MKELFEAIRAGDLSRVSALVEANPSLAIFACKGEEAVTDRDEAEDPEQPR